MTLQRRWGAALAFGMAILATTAARGDVIQQPPAPEPKARPDLVRQPYSAADVDFMSGMIPHHAQAVAACAVRPAALWMS